MVKDIIKRPHLRSKKVHTTASQETQYCQLGSNIALLTVDANVFCSIYWKANTKYLPFSQVFWFYPKTINVRFCIEISIKNTLNTFNNAIQRVTQGTFASYNHTNLFQANLDSNFWEVFKNRKLWNVYFELYHNFAVGKNILIALYAFIYIQLL